MLTSNEGKDNRTQTKGRSSGRKRKKSEETSPVQCTYAYTTKTWTRGGTIVPNLGKGNCLFHAMASALEDARPAKEVIDNFVLGWWLLCAKTYHDMKPNGTALTAKERQQSKHSRSSSISWPIKVVGLADLKPR